MDLRDAVRSIKDFPKEGIIFRDVTTLFKNPEAFHQLMDEIAETLKDKNVDVVVGPEARGCAMGAPLAYLLNAGFVPVSPAYTPVPATRRWAMPKASSSCSMRFWVSNSSLGRSGC